MTTSTSRVSQDLIDRYLQAVGFWLPRSQQADILAELSDDLRAQVEENERDLGRPLDEEETTAILKRCGSPLVVASRYQPQTQLIGPVLFPIYKFVMKIVLFWLIPTLFFVVVAPALIFKAGDHFGAFFSVVRAFGNAMFTAAAVITVVFALIERSRAKLQLAEKWDARAFARTPRRPERSTSRVQTVFEVLFSFLTFLWLVAVPFYPFLLLGPAAAFLKFAPSWSHYYWVLLLIAFVGTAQQGIGLARPTWKWFPAASGLFSTALGFLFVGIVLSLATQTPNGEWHPYVVLVDSLQSSARMREVGSIVNLSILLSMAIAWLGLCIAALVHAWRFMRFLRENRLGSGSPALMQLF
jgi:hypothetical protein